MKRASLLLVSVIALGSNGMAAEPEEAPVQQHVETMDRQQSPLLDARTGFLGSGILLTADGDSSKVAISLSRSRDFTTEGLLGFHGVSIKASSPIDKASSTGNFVTDGGITNSTAIEFAYAGGWAPDSELPEDKTKCTGVDRSQCDDAWLNSPMWFYGLAAGAGYRDFSFRDPASLAKKSRNQVPYSFSANLGLSPSATPSYLGMGYEYKKDYKDSETKTFCPNPPTGSPNECVTGSFAPPVGNSSSTIFAVGRYQIGGGENWLPIPVGVELKIVYETRKDTFGVGMPIYMFATSKGKLRGGVRFEWDDESDELRVGVFVGAPFSVFGGS